MDHFSRFDPGEDCGQFGVPCRRYDEASETEKGKDGEVRRKEATMNDLGINEETEPCKSC